MFDAHPCHPDLVLTGASDAAVAAEVQGVPEWLQANCPSMLFPTMTIIRPPCGSLTNAQARYIHDTLGYTFATWAIDSLDWTGIDLPQKVNVVMNAYNDLPSGSSAIILHHDGYYTMPGAQGILDFCAARFAGYDFVTIEECLAQCHALGACKASGSALPCVFDS